MRSSTESVNNRGKYMEENPSSSIDHWPVIVHNEPAGLMLHIRSLHSSYRRDKNSMSSTLLVQLFMQVYEKL
uniref:Uncharacterized protein n=1 Tax=Megaselia scalaris TaxID=36166 RepID=T1GBC2_MEGSC